MNVSSESILSKEEADRVPVNGEKVIDVEKAEEKRELKGWITDNKSSLISYFVFGVVSSLYLYGFLYNHILKPYILPSLSTAVWKPFVSFLDGIKYGTIIFYLSLLVATVAYLAFDTNDNRSRLIPISGLCAFLVVGYAFSSNRSMIPWKTILWGLILQFTFGLITIRWKVGRNILECIGDKVNILLGYAFEGAAFTYGDFLVNDKLVFAFRALSTIYFISFLVNILYYFGVMQKVIGFLGELLQWIMGTSICESVNSAANIFLGQSEAPLLLAPYLKDLTDSEIHSVMTSGIMSAPAALCFSKLMYPETEEIKVQKENVQAVDNKGVSDAIAMVQGIIASVLAFLAFVYLINGVLGWFGELVGFMDPRWSLELIAGKIFIPISFLMGVPWEECESVGTLIGIKTMVNEFVAFAKMKEMLDQGLLSKRTKVIATYAICGFSNPGSVGIMISALSTLIPHKREAVTRLVLRAFFGGALVCFMTACIACALMPEDAVA
nr:unnamed protein product [Callosobruchus chinensis]